MRLQQLLALAAVVPAALAGCLAPEEASEWRDDINDARADETAHEPDREPITIVVEGNIAGDKDEDKLFEVPLGVPELRIVAAYSVGGSAHFTLYDPHENAVQDDDVLGGSSRTASDWYVVADPHDGTWFLRISGLGGGSYRFEITY